MALSRTLLAMTIAVLAVIGFVVWSGIAVADGDPSPAPVGVAAPVAGCPAGFDTRTKESPPTVGGGMALSVDEITAYRAGRHDPCFDRLVVDVDGRVGGFRVGYVPEIISDPKGDVLTVPGQARLAVTIGNPDMGKIPPTGAALLPTQRFASWVEFRSVIFAGSFENVTSLGLGVDEPRGFRVLALPPGPGHPRTGMLVVDVAHA